MKWRDLKTSFKTINQSASGSALAEFALVLPLLALLLTVGVEVSRIVYHYHIATKGVQDAARYLSRSEAVNTGDLCGTPNADWTNAVSAAKNLALYGNVAGSGSLILSSWNTTGSITVTLDCQTNAALVSPLGAGAQIPVINVSTSFAYDSLGLLGFLNASGFTIQATHKEMGIGG